LFSVVLLPAIGSKWALVVISLGYLALLPLNPLSAVPVPAGAPRRHRRSGEHFTRLAFALVAIVIVLRLPANLELVQLPPGGKLVEYREGVMASVAVVQDPTGNFSLRVNNRFQMGGTGAADAERRHAHIPLLLHPDPKRALFLGLGTGITFGTAAIYPGLQADGVELLPEVAGVMDRFAPYNNSPDHQAQLKLYNADARRFVRCTDARYDVIVADLFHPARDGAGLLYTVEQFQAIRERLAPGGLFCQWLPLHQLDESMLRVIGRTFLEVFPNAHAYLLRFNVDAPVLGLVGTLDSPRYSTQWVERRLSAPELEAQLKQLALADSIRLFGCLAAGPDDLREFAGKAALNTDDRQRVTFAAPRFIYQQNALPYGRLFALIQRPKRDPAKWLDLEADPSASGFLRRLEDFIRARDVYLHGLAADAEGRESQAIDAYVDSARLSSDFTLGYAQCLTWAAVKAKANPAAARALLERLVQAQPARPIARDLLRRLFE
jgi:spermidine synthase